MVSGAFPDWLYCMKELDFFEFFHLCVLQSAPSSPPAEALPAAWVALKLLQFVAFPCVPQSTGRGHQDISAPSTSLGECAGLQICTYAGLGKDSRAT